MKNLSETEAEVTMQENVVHESLPQIPVATSVSCCFVLAVLYVGSLYIWSTKHNRDHPTTVKRSYLC